MESLNQLENILAPEDQVPESDYQPEEACSVKEQANSEILEQMAADLDAFFGDASESTS